MSAVAASSPRTRFRWVVCGLLFFVTANNYMDRQVFGVVAAELIRHFGWSTSDYASVVFWFQVAYGIGFIVSGKILDAVGSRIGLGVAVCLWSAAAAAHGAVGSLLGFKVVRLVLGLTEPSHMPAAIKVVAEWFPKSERALATGIYKAGSNVGAIAVPLIVPWIFVHYGWRATFVLTGLTGFVWLGFWLWLYRRPEVHPRVSPAELAHIRSDPVPPPPPRLSWRAVLRHKETWAYMNFKFMTDAMWHWYGAMFPLYLAQHFGLKLKDFGLPLIVVYLIADIGSIGGGWLSSALIQRGASITYARKLAMFVCCAATVPVIAVGVTQSLWLAVVLVGVAHAAHQGLTSNLFTVVSDLFPRNAVGTVVGLGGSIGQVGAALMTVVTAWVLAKYGNFTLLFLVAGSTYLIAWAIFHWVVPSFEPIEMKKSHSE